MRNLNWFALFGGICCSIAAIINMILGNYSIVFIMCGFVVADTLMIYISIEDDIKEWRRTRRKQNDVKLMAFNPETQKPDLEVTVPSSRQSDYVCKHCGKIVGGCFEDISPKGWMEQQVKFRGCPRCGLSGEDHIMIVRHGRVR